MILKRYRKILTDGSDVYDVVLEDGCTDTAMHFPCITEQDSIDFVEKVMKAIYHHTTHFICTQEEVEIHE